MPYVSENQKMDNTTWQVLSIPGSPSVQLTTVSINDLYNQEN
jgi:hypothetical protein